MARLINLSTPDNGVINGMELSFQAPCDCTDVTGITLDGKTYEIVDASGNSLASCSNYFAKGSTLTVIIDTVNRKATLLNPRVNTYTKSLGTPDDEASDDGNTAWAKINSLTEWKHNLDEGSASVPKASISDMLSPIRERTWMYGTVDSVWVKFSPSIPDGVYVVVAELDENTYSGIMYSRLGTHSTFALSHNYWCSSIQKNELWFHRDGGSPSVKSCKITRIM